jgi:outer membrane protein assembly factor BamB
MNETGLSMNLKWEFAPSDGTGYLCSAVVAADADNDGECEAIVGSYTRSLYCLRGSDGTEKWSYRLPRDMVGCNCVLLDDVDNDGELEVIFGTEPNPTVYVLKSSSGIADRLLWKRELEGAFIAGGLVSFADTDGRKKIVACTRRADLPDRINHGRAYLLDGATGEMLLGPLGDEDVCSSVPAVGDVDGDGELEFIYGNHRWRDIPHGGCVVCRRVRDGSVVWSYPTPDDTGANTMSICDIDGDGKLEVIAGYLHYKDVVEPSYGTLALSGADGRVLWERNLWAGQEVAVGQVDGRKVICAGGHIEDHQEITCVDAADGSVVWSNDMRSGCKATPFAVDIDRDGADEFIMGDANNNLLVVSGRDGRLLFRESYAADRRVTEKSKPGVHHISVADVDGDGCWEILFNSSDGVSRCLDAGIPVQPGCMMYFCLQGGTAMRLGNMREV